MLQVVERPTDRAPATRPSCRIEDRELAVVDRAADDLAGPTPTRARRTPARPNRRDRRRSRGRRRGARSPPSMLSAAVLPWLKATSQCSTEAAGRRARRFRTPRYRRLRRSRARRSADANRRSTPPPLAEIQPRPPRQRDVGDRAGADHDRIGVELASALGDHARHAPVGALEPVELVARHGP